MIDDLLPHAPLELCSYWGCGQVFGVIYEVSYEKIQGLDGAFLRFEIGKYVEYLTPVSSEYIKR